MLRSCRPSSNQLIPPLSFISSPERHVAGLYDFVGEEGVAWNPLVASVVVAVIPVDLLSGATKG